MTDYSAGLEKLQATYDLSGKHIADVSCNALGFLPKKMEAHKKVLLVADKEKDKKVPEAAAKKPEDSKADPTKPPGAAGAASTAASAASANISGEPPKINTLKDFEYQRIQYTRQALLHYLNSQMLLHAKHLELYADTFERLEEHSDAQDFALSKYQNADWVLKLFKGQGEQV